MPYFFDINLTSNMEGRVMNIKKTIPFFLVLLVFSGLSSAQTTPQGELTNLSFQKGDQQGTVQLKCSKPVTYETFSLLNPNRLVLDLTAIGSISSPMLLEINDMGIQKVTVSAQSADTARILVYFMDDIPKYKIEENEQGLDLVFMKEAPQEKLSDPIETPATGKAKILPETKITKPERPAVSSVKASSRIKDMNIGIDIGYFFFQDALFQEAYDKKAQNIRGEFAFRLPVPVDNFDIWTAVSHYSKDGKTSLYEENLNFSSTTFSIALRYLRKIKFFTPFAGVGLDYISYKETFPENFPVSSVGGSKTGYHLQGGAYIHITPSFSGKIQIRYLSASATEDNITVNLGGVEYSIGLNFHFDL